MLSNRSVSTPRFVRRLAAALLLLAWSLPASADDAWIKGEVKKIDEAAGKITLKHGPIPSLGMDEPMTMVFQVKDGAVLKQVRVGDRVRFEAAEGTSEGLVVTRLEKAK